MGDDDQMIKQMEHDDGAWWLQDDDCRMMEHDDCGMIVGCMDEEKWNDWEERGEGEWVSPLEHPP